MNEKLKKILKNIVKTLSIIIGLPIVAIICLYFGGLFLMYSFYLLDGDFKVMSFEEFCSIESCLDDGGCWNYNHHRCETKDYGFCYNDEADCNRNDGIWLDDLKYCKFVKSNNNLQ